MKKLLISFLFCSLFIGNIAYAQDSAEFSFSWKLLDSLHSCRLAEKHYLAKADKLSQRMENMQAVNKELEKAKEPLKAYLVDKNEKISTMAEGILVGIELLIENNNLLIGSIKKMKELDTAAINGFDKEFKNIKDKVKEGWQLISLSSSHLFYVIVDQVKESNMKRPLQFKISPSEKQRLFERVEKYFKDEIQRYDRYKALEQKGKKTNPEDQTYLSFAVARIRDMLTVSNYKEAKDKGLLR